MSMWRSSDELRTMRAKVTGQVLTLDAALQDDDPGAAVRSWTPCRTTARF